jgi:hypothetical protein
MSVQSAFYHRALFFGRSSFPLTCLRIQKEAKFAEVLKVCQQDCFVISAPGMQRQIRDTDSAAKVRGYLKQKTIENTSSLFPEEDRMSFERALELTKKFYGNYPGPTESTYALANQVADYFQTQNINTAGVIAVGIGSDDYYYLGLSPDLQSKVMTAMSGGEPPPNAHFRLGDGLEKSTGVAFDLCRKVADDIIEKAQRKNPGCAEKKIVSEIYALKVTLKEISVIPYPDTIWGENLPAHVAVSGADGVLIAPCESCRKIYNPT